MISSDIVFSTNGEHEKWVKDITIIQCKFSFQTSYMYLITYLTIWLIPVIDLSNGGELPVKGKSFHIR